MPTPLVILGASGHASDVLACVEDINTVSHTFDVLGLLVDPGYPFEPGRFIGRCPGVIGLPEDLASIDAEYVIGIGYPAARRAVWERIARLGRRAASLIHPDARVSTGVEIGEGAVIMGGARCGPLVTIGRHVHLGQLAVVGHDTQVEGFATVMPAAAVSGNVTLAEGSLVGSGAVVVEGLRIGRGSTVGAGAVATRDVPDGMTVVGVPGRAMQHDPSSG